MKVAVAWRSPSLGRSPSRRRKNKLGFCLLRLNNTPQKRVEAHKKRTPQLDEAYASTSAYKATSDELEHETTIPTSELMQQHDISPKWPLSTCMGPSIRFILLSKGLFAVILSAVGVVLESEESLDVLTEYDVDALYILQSKTVASRDPVTRYLLSREVARHVTGAQCHLAISKVLAVSADISLTLLSACPPGYTLIS
nr:hypothetical protein TorRG33x02_305530 [Ipomoea batatas]